MPGVLTVGKEREMKSQAATSGTDLKPARVADQTVFLLERFRLKLRQ